MASAPPRSRPAQVPNRPLNPALRAPFPSEIRGLEGSIASTSCFSRPGMLIISWVVTRSQRRLRFLHLSWSWYAPISAVPAT
jgi:hypothetical protein